MPGKKWLIDANALERHDTLLTLEVDYSIDQQERISMRENSLDLVDVEGRLCPDRSLGCRWCAVAHSVSQ